jgi:hypothetical protein
MEQDQERQEQDIDSGVSTYTPLAWRVEGTRSTESGKIKMKIAIS